MASKKAGRLAGLAALASLAYMATRDKDKGAAKSKTKENPVAPKKDTAAEDNRIADRRAASEEDKSTALFMSGEDERPAPEGMGAATKFVTRPKAARPPASSASIATDPRDPGGAEKRSAASPGPNPARDPGGAGKRRGVSSEAEANIMDLPPYRENPDSYDMSMKKGGKVKKMASGGSTSSASKRGDGIAQRGKTKGRVC